MWCELSGAKSPILVASKKKGNEYIDASFATARRVESCSEFGFMSFPFLEYGVGKIYYSRIYREN